MTKKAALCYLSAHLEAIFKHSRKLKLLLSMFKVQVVLSTAHSASIHFRFNNKKKAASRLHYNRENLHRNLTMRDGTIF